VGLIHTTVRFFY